MARLPLVTPDFGLVTIGTSPQVSLHTPAWQCVNSYLLTDPAPKRRKNQVRPNVAGTLGAPSYPDVWSVELEVQIIGDWTKDGVLNSNAAQGAEENYWYLRENIWEQAEDDQGRIGVGVTSAIPGGVYLGYVQLDNFRREPIKDTMCCFLEVTIPSGGLVYVEA